MGNNRKNRIHLIFGALLFAGFFQPWAKWKDTPISGYYMPSGKFFDISSSQFGLDNPFPQLNFSFYVFWLIPAGILLIYILFFLNKKTRWPAVITGMLTLALVTVYYLFSSVLVDLGIGKSALSLMKIGALLSALSAIGLIVTTIPPMNWLKKAAALIAGPLFAFLGFMIIQKTIWNQTYSNTKDIKPEYTVDALSLIREFTANDNAANQKYREKIVQVNGTASLVEKKADSTVNIQFADSTGSYIIFSFDKEQYDHVKNIQSGETISAKGSCSGSIRSEILGTTSISFKRSTINKNKQ